MSSPSPIVTTPSSTDIPSIIPTPANDKAEVSQSKVVGLRLRTNMATYNATSSYNRTYEKKVIEEGSPRVRVTTQTHTPLSHIMPDLSLQGLSHVLPTFPGSTVHLGSQGSSVQSVRTTDNSFYATLDVSLYDADTLKVSVVDQFIVIEGAHGEKEDTFGTIERTFRRKFALPKSVAPEAVTSQLTNDGILTVEAKAPEPKDNVGARPIPIKVVSNEQKPHGDEQKQ